MTTADGISVDHGNDRLRQPPYLHLHVENVQTWHAVVADISSTPLHMHVAARTKGLVAGTGEQHHAYFGVLTAKAERLRYLPRGLWCERIAIAFAVDGNLGDVVILLKKDFLEILQFSPFSFFHINVVVLFSYACKGTIFPYDYPHYSEKNVIFAKK